MPAAVAEAATSFESGVTATSEKLAEAHGKSNLGEAPIPTSTCPRLA